MGDRITVAREAARLLYTGTAEEYIQAKEMAAANIEARANPSNHEVAEELDRLADELEGSDRVKQLVEMRGVALEVMNALAAYAPKLIGSVWRGTAHRGSDIDIIAFSEIPSNLEKSLKHYNIAGKGEVVLKGKIRAYRILLDVGKFKVEIVVRNLLEYKQEKCGIYGDLKRGLSILELENLLHSNPLRRFVPRRRVR